MEQFTGARFPGTCVGPRTSREPFSVRRQGNGGEVKRARVLHGLQHLAGGNVPNHRVSIVHYGFEMTSQPARDHRQIGGAGQDVLRFYLQFLGKR